MGFQQGLSGLNAASRALDVISNNVANANTVGFKQAQAQFADVFANSLNGGGGGNSVGIGTRVAAIAQLFSQGNITTTNNPLDTAINGNGFFRLSNNGAITYSRNGQFSLNRSGEIVNAQGLNLTGYLADANGVLSTGSAVPLRINTADIAPRQTDNVTAVLNLDSRELVPGTQLPVANPPVITPVPFSITDPTTYNRATTVDVFDSLGNRHQLQTFFVKVDPLGPPPRTPAGTATSEWDVFAAVDGVLINGTAGSAANNNVNAIGTLGFNNVGTLTAASPPFSATDPTSLAVAVPVTSGAITPISLPTIKIDYAGTSQYGSTFSVNTLNQDGYTSGRLAQFNTAADGTIVGTYTNGRTAVLAQVVLANFVNPNGLQSLGDNQWAETAESGAALVATPGSGSLGVLNSNATEDSNTDLTAELVNLITAQRVYQANAQTIKTEDQVLQTLVNLR
jgi:flagellar hook protein FlgE